MKHANYRKINDGTLSSSTYHKKDGTNIRNKLKEIQNEELEEIDDFEDQEYKYEDWNYKNL